MPSGPLAATLRDTHALFAAGTVAGLNDDELLRRFAARRDAVAEVAFAALVARHGPMVLAVCRRALADQHEAEDAFQTTFLVLARRASSVRGATLGPWLYGVARRVARRARADALRCRANRGFDQRELKLVNGAGEDVASAAERAEVVVLVDEELAQLSGRDRAALILCDLGGLTHEQAAERLGWPVGTVKSRQARARGRLRARLARRGLAPAIAASLLEAAMSARAAPAPWLVRSTVGQAQWFVMRAVPAGTVPAGVVAAAESILKGMIMTKLKLTGVVAALALSAAIGVAAVRAQDRPVPARGVSPSADVAGPQGVAAGQPDRMRALEDKLDRLLRVLESPGAKPGSGRVPLQMGTDPVIGVPRLDLPPAPANGMSPRGLQGAPPKPVANPLMELERDMSPTTRLNDHERRLAAVERKLEQLMSRLPPAPPPGDAVETAPRTSGNIPLRTDSEPALSLVPGPAPGDDIAPEPSSEPGRN